MYFALHWAGNDFHHLITTFIKNLEKEHEDIEDSKESIALALLEWSQNYLH